MFVEVELIFVANISTILYLEVSDLFYQKTFFRKWFCDLFTQIFTNSIQALLSVCTSFVYVSLSGFEEDKNTTTWIGTVCTCVKQSFNLFRRVIFWFSGLTITMLSFCNTLKPITLLITGNINVCILPETSI